MLDAVDSNSAGIAGGYASQIISALNERISKDGQAVARGIMLKGAGVDVLYPHLLALAGFAGLVVGVSAWRFRKQLG